MLDSLYNISGKTNPAVPNILYSLYDISPSSPVPLLNDAIIVDDVITVVSDAIIVVAIIECVVVAARASL